MKSWALAAPSLFLVFLSQVALSAEAFKTPLGLALSADCLRFLESKKVKASEDEIRDNISRLAQNAWDKVASCEKRYPELSPYFVEWRKRLSKGLVTCPFDHTSDALSDAMASASALNQEITFSANAAEAILGSKYTDAYEAEGRFYSHGLAIEILVHEYLHKSGADNLRGEEHYDFERIAPGSAGRCGEDITIDRVSLLSHLCIPESSPRLRPDILESLYYREILCEKHYECEKTFTDAGHENFFADFLGRTIGPGDKGRRRPFGLGKDQARSVCSKLMSEQHCLVSKVRAADEINAKNPALSAFANRLKARLEEFFPVNADTLPMAVLESFPALKRGYAALKDTECFKKYLRQETNSAGQTSLVFVNREGYQDPPRPKPRRDLLLFKNFRISGFEQIPKCEQPDHAKALKSWVSEVLLQISRSETKSRDFIVLAQDRSRGHGEDIRYWNRIQESLSMFESDGDVTSVLGQSLHSEYLAALKAELNVLPDFNCDKEGLSPYKAVERSKRMHGLIRDIFEQQKSCGQIDRARQQH